MQFDSFAAIAIRRPKLAQAYVALLTCEIPATKRLLAL